MSDEEEPQLRIVGLGQNLIDIQHAATAPFQFASAVTKDWTGATNTDFSLGSNWGGTAPTSADTVRFSTLTTNKPTLTVSTTVDRVIFNVATGGGTIGGAGKVLTISNSQGVLVDASATHSGSNTISADMFESAAGTSYIISGSGGTLVFNGALSAASGAVLKQGNAAVNNGTVVLNAASTGFSGAMYLINYGDTVIGADNVFGSGTLGINGTGKIVTAGSRSLSSSMIFQQTGVINLTGTLASSGNVELTSTGQIGQGQRSINANGSLTLSGAVVNGANSGTGAGITLNSGTTVGKLILSGSNAYTGSTIVSNGTLLVNGNQSSATGAVSVASTATLGGIGTIGGATSVSGKLAAGNNSVGLLSFSNGLALTASAESIFEINGLNRGTDFDAINITGSLFYNGVLTLDFGFGAQVGQTFDLFDFTSQSGSFTSLNFVDLGYNGTFNAASGVLTLTSVPEPGVTALLVGAGLTLLVIRRRRSVV